MKAEHRVEVAVVGGGVVGLAIARALALAGREVLLLEAESRVGTHTSSRNSEVIHAGIYYPQGSLKARLCVAGNKSLYTYCERRQIEHQRLGKLIVAVRDEELPALAELARQARLNGVTDLEPLSASEVNALEPAVTAVAGLWSPSSGIIDSHGLMSALRADAEASGAVVLLRTPVLSGELTEAGIVLATGGGEPAQLLCRHVVNSAGLWAQELAGKLRGLPPEAILPRYFAKGHYFSLLGRSPFRHLVYPIPEPGGLGVHVTLDLGGRARFGPDVSWLDGVDYAFDEGRAGAFYRAIRGYFPALADGGLEPAYTGIRPKLGPRGSPASDFVIQDAAAYGAPGLVNLFGIESPGLTASLEIARLVSEMIA